MPSITVHTCSWLLAIAVLAGGVGGALSAAEEAGAEEEVGTRRRVNFHAMRQLRTAKRLLDSGQEDRAVGALENLLERYPESFIRFEANLMLGRYYLQEEARPKDAIEYLRRVESITETAAVGEELQGDALDIYLEAMYLRGVANYDLRQYPKCFPILRRITNKYPNTVWANQAYYYIGMAHFVQENWGKAIRYLSLVGTYIDPEAESTRYVEAGRRLYVKVTDADLPILQKLGALQEKGRVLVEARSGDRAELALSALSRRENIYVATVATEVGAPDPTDSVLQIVGGDEITVRYPDANTSSGESNVMREKKVQVVSSGSVSFTDATYEGKAKQAYTGQHIHLLLKDIDLDTDSGQQTYTLKVAARYQVEREQEEVTDFTEARFDERDEGPQWELRDEVEIELTELSNAELEAMQRVGDGDEGAGAGNGGGEAAPADEIHHTGSFVGRIPLVALGKNLQPDTDDNVLTCQAGDQIHVRYLDELHADGDYEKVVEDSVKVVGSWNETIRQSSSVGADVVIESKKNLVEGRAFLELATIFKNMGLMKGCRRNMTDGLQRANEVITQADISDELKQEAFKLRWELYLLVDELPKAVATMQLFGQQYPDSRFADEALVGIGKAYEKQKEYKQAIGIYQKVLDLPESDAKAEAQYRIAKAIAASQSDEAAIPHYRKVAENYPDSQHTGDALAELVDYHIKSNDFVAANNLLTIIFDEHPDKGWLDRMLVKWIILAYRMQDYDKSYQKASQLLMEYPDSKYADKVRQMLDRIDKKRKQAAGN